MVRPDNDNERIVLEFFTVLSTGDLERLRSLLTSGAGRGLGRSVAQLGREEDNAQAIAFSLSREASFINGTVLHVDGGITASM